MELDEPQDGGCGHDNGPGRRTVGLSSENDVTPLVEQWTTYGKTGGHANMTGELFEVKMAALLYVRGLNRTGDFWLTSNMSSAELFDDLTFVHKDKAANMWAACLQLKHKQIKVGECVASSIQVNDEQNKETKCIQSQSLMALSGNFSLVSYFKSFITVKRNHRNHKDLAIIPKFSNIQFVLYTNACVATSLLKDLIEVDEGGLYTTGGKVYKLDPEGKISLGLKEFFTLKLFLEGLKRDVDALPMCEKEDWIKERINGRTDGVNGDCKEWQQLRKTPCLKGLERILSLNVFEFDCTEDVLDEFINNLVICTGQTSECELEKLVKTEMKTLCVGMNDVELDNMYDEIIKRITKWWRYENLVLNANSKIWLDIIHAHVGTLARSRNDELRGFEIEFLDTSMEILTKTINDSLALVVETIGQQTVLSTIKVLNILQPKGLHLHSTIFLNLDVLAKRKDEILTVWKSKWFNTLIVECEPEITSVLNAQLGKELQKLLESFSKRIVLIAKKGHSFTTEMKRLTTCDEIVDDTCWSDLSVTSQNILRAKKVNFQGCFVTLGDLMGDNSEQLASKLDGVSLNLLLSDVVTIGKELIETNEFYVPRKVGSGNDYIHLLSDVPERAVLITGEPGIGKSFLINKLAKSSKEKDNSLWIASITMSECEDYLEELNLKDINRETCVEFIKKFSTNSSIAFEDEFFKHCADTDKMIVLLDAIDEVSPNYECKVKSILECLRETKLRALWVTSRLGMQGTIERVLKVASKKLVYFSKVDQTNLLKAFWKSRHPEMDEENFVKITSAFWKLTSMTFIDESLLTGIPQLTIMLAETFEKELLNTKLDPIAFQPKSLDLLQLYDAFVKKKHDMYFKANKNEQEKNFKIFMNNHMLAAVWTLFSKYDYAGLVIPNRDTVELELKRFCEEIKNGREKTGIIDGFSTTMHRPRFMHRTFCEYFAAKWISINFEGNVDFLLKKMFHSSFKIVNVLLNRILANERELHVCVLNCDLNGLESLLRTRPETVHEIDQGGRTAFHLVTLMWDRHRRATHVNMARILLQHGTSIDARENVLNLRPLEIADKTMAWTVAGLILQHGGDVHDLKTTENNMNDDVFEEFIEFLSRPDGNVAELLSTATKHDDKYLIRHLVEERNADVNCPSNEDGATLMHWAAFGGHINLMSYLRKNGGSYLGLDKNLNLPLHYAANHGGKNAVEYLIENGSEIDAVNGMSETPLLIAAGSSEADLEVIKYLILKGANISACNGDDLPALYLAVESGKFDTVKYLCNAMQPIDVERFGQSAFQCALERNDWRIVNYLRDKAKISLPKTVLPVAELFSLVVKLIIALTILTFTVFSFVSLLNAVPDVFTSGMYSTLKLNATNTREDHYRRNLPNGTSLFVEGHPFLQSVDEQTQDGKSNANEEMESNNTRTLTVWFVDYQLSVQQDVIWKVILNAMTLALISLNLGCTSFLFATGLISWSLGLLLSEYSLELASVLAAGFSWAVIFLLARQATRGFQGYTGRFFNRALNVFAVVIWTFSLTHTSHSDVGRVFIISGAIKVTIGVFWRHEIPLERRFYNVFLTIHSTGILCAVWFSWIHESDWPIWLTWSSRLVLVGYVAGVATFVRAERLLPKSLDKAFKTKMKLRFAWLLLLVPMWSYVSAGTVLWITELSWARWLVVLVVPLPVFTVFFEWGRHQLLMTDRKT